VEASSAELPTSMVEEKKEKSPDVLFAIFRRVALARACLILPKHSSLLRLLPSEAKTMDVPDVGRG